MGGSNGQEQGARVTCSRCGFVMALSEDELFHFFPNFACLRCGAKLQVPIDRAAYLQLQGKNDRERRPPGQAAQGDSGTARTVRKGAENGGVEGG